MKANFNEHDALNGRALLENSVAVDDTIRKVVINHLVVESPELFELLRKCNTEFERISETRKVIDIGAFVKNKVQMAVDTGYLDRRVSDMTGEFEKGIETFKADLLATIAQKFDPSKSDSYTDKIQKFFDEAKAEFAKQIQDSLLELSNGKKAICTKINESFDPELKSSHISKFMESVDKLHTTIRNDFDLNKAGSITHQMKELIKETLGENGELAKSIDHRLSFDNPNSTIAILQQNLVKKLDEIKTELVASRSAVEAEKAALEKSTQKGFDFEDILMEYLEDFASQRGDLVEDVSKRQGEVTRSKKGDFVYTVTSLNKTIAIEARKPITLLFGPNSAGKSTIIQALHYAREVLERKNFERWIHKLTKRFNGGELSLKELPPKFIASIIREEDVDYDLPDLPLPVPFKEYVEKIRERARMQAAGNMSEVDRLLGQNPGTEKQMQFRRKQKNAIHQSITGVRGKK